MILSKFGKINLRYSESEERTSCNKCKECSKWKYCLGDSFHTFNFDEKRPNFCIKTIEERISDN